MPLSAQGLRGHGFGTAPVFLASISTILGAILFLRVGYAVAHVGLAGTLGIIFLGHLVTFPASLAIAEIATNQRVEGGGVYYIISRSFGATIGGAIGVALYFSQALSVAFYLIAFAESFRPLSMAFEEALGRPYDPRMVSVPATILLTLLVAVRGADIGVKALWGVVVVLGASLVFFFAGPPIAGTGGALSFTATIDSPDSFGLVFAIVFPAFTGITAGVGLSGDLKDPRRSIPLGTLAATLVGMLIYIAVAVKLATSAGLEDLAGDELVMARIAVWGPMIPIGLGCASISSAIGSILVAPRTAQALAMDRVLPLGRLNAWTARGVGKAQEPRNATLFTATMALLMVAVGNVDSVARIISMFFMVTYGALCAISFLESFAARPDYRPSFRTKWYVSLVGAVVCVLLAFQMDPFYALASTVAMVALYRAIRVSRRDQEDDFAAIFQGVMTQASRFLQVRLQSLLGRETDEEWRPSIIMVNGRTFERVAPVQFLCWMCHRFAVGTYLHYMKGFLTQSAYVESRQVKQRLIERVHSRGISVFVETMLSPSYRSALAQSLQVPSVTGKEHNLTLFEFSMHDGQDVLDEVRDGCDMAWMAQKDVLVLRHGDEFFGARRRIHLWLTMNDYDNANLMILLAYILVGHPDWRRAEVQAFAAFPRDQAEEEETRLRRLAASGRVPISPRRLEVIPTEPGTDFESLVQERSAGADLVLRGFTEEKLTTHGPALFRRHEGLKDVLFVSSRRGIHLG